MMVQLQRETAYAAQEELNCLRDYVEIEYGEDEQQ
jgi:hypothetical protein